MNTIKWLPVSKKFDFKKHEPFTLVKVEGWHRYAFGCYNHFLDGWTIESDPALDSEKSAKITHWLAMPNKTN
jgi:hypothetical protein